MNILTYLSVFGLQVCTEGRQPISLHTEPDTELWSVSPGQMLFTVIYMLCLIQNFNLEFQAPSKLYWDVGFGEVNAHETHTKEK